MFKKGSTRHIGNIGEDLACKYLIGKGFRIVDRNYLKKWGEIDIVCKKDRILHFIEVKSVYFDPKSMNKDKHRPEDNVHDLKLRHLRRVIETYLGEYRKGHDIEFCVDVVCVYLRDPILKSEIKFIDNVII